MSTRVVIDRRFNGPPESANGGYACGLVAGRIDGTASARLLVPPPLDREMALEVDGASSRLMDGDVVVGEAAPATLDGTVPGVPTLAAARRASERYVGFVVHAFDTCFVCGPRRQPGDGLRIFPGPVDGLDVVAAPWLPHESLAGETGAVARPFVWAALDCPSYFGMSQTPPALLAGMTADIERLPGIGEELVAIGWHEGSEGRKHRCGSALATADGEVFARASTLWIEPSSPLW